MEMNGRVASLAALTQSIILIAPKNQELALCLYNVPKVTAADFFQNLGSCAPDSVILSLFI